MVPTHKASGGGFYVGKKRLMFVVLFENLFNFFAKLKLRIFI